MLCGISECKSETGASRLKVSSSVPPNSATLRSMVLLLLCLRAARARGLLLSASLPL